MAWIWFAVVQLICLIATVFGWVLLIPFCVCHAWVVDTKSSKDGRSVDRWRFAWLGAIYGNPEDGVSGQQAILWNDEGTELVPFMPGANPAWRAWMWSAWRNSADNLKYVFAWARGPLTVRTVKILGRAVVIKAGWQEENGANVPVFSVSRG